VRVGVSVRDSQRFPNGCAYNVGGDCSGWWTAVALSLLTFGFYRPALGNVAAAGFSVSVLLVAFEDLAMDLGVLLASRQLASDVWEIRSRWVSCFMWQGWYAGSFAPVLVTVSSGVLSHGH